MFSSRRIWTSTCSGALFVALMIGSLFAPTQGGTAGSSVKGARVTSGSHAQAAAGKVVQPPAARRTTRGDASTSIARTSGDPRDVFGGLGAWIDLYDLGLRTGRVIPMLQKNHVRTLYIQTGRSNTPFSVHPGLGRWLVAAHRAGIRVVGWYLPYYRDAKRDARRVLAIERYRYQGHRFDGLGIDIEFRPFGMKAHNWNRNVARVAKAVRHHLPNYPVAAIPPPPLQMQVSTSHWAGFPWGTIGRYSDAVMLMSYWSDRRGCPAVRLFCAYEYTSANVKLTRTLVGDRPAVHIIGGIGNAMNDTQLRAFIRAARDAGADGASIYDVATMKARWWRSLATLRTLGR